MQIYFKIFYSFIFHCNLEKSFQLHTFVLSKTKRYEKDIQGGRNGNRWYHRSQL